ncbi:MAG: hypothetical protein E6Q97_20730, partial [Desulfurellales bacterium]
MTELVSPQPGQWWVMDGPPQDHHEGWILFCIGSDSTGRFRFEDCDGNVEAWVDPPCGYHHEPECDGFDWKPEVFPQWYRRIDETGDFFVNKRIDRTNVVRVYADGREVSWEYPWNDRSSPNLYVKITEAEAMAMPAESPDDWVTQDRVPVRECDERRWVNVETRKPSNEGNDWRNAGKELTTIHFKGFRHGDKACDGEILELRCRRKDLPVVVPVVTHEPDAEGRFVETRREDVVVECATNDEWVELTDREEVLRPDEELTSASNLCDLNEETGKKALQEKSEG